MGNDHSQHSTSTQHTSTRRSNKQYNIWYRHTGQRDPGEKWYLQSAQFLTLQQIEESVGRHRITHMCIEHDVPPDLHKLAPHLTHLYLDGLTEEASSNLEWIGELEDLQELLVLWSEHLLTLPDSIGNLHRLTHLDVSYKSNLESLPESIGNLQKLKRLDLSRNSSLKSLPESLGNLRRLTHLNLEYNTSLESLPASISKLKSLKEVDVTGCVSLKSPPREVCDRGVKSIRQYLKDLASGSKIITPAVTVAVIGRTMAGKTSLIRTLQNEAKKRVLTNRTPDAVADEATKVFNVEEVKADDVLLRFIDVGGQDVYHSTYQLTFRNSCIVLLVVNIEEYGKMRREEHLSSREAARLLCFDWLSQMYLACPNLHPPKLVFTHSDRFQSDIFKQLKFEFLVSCQALKEEVVEAYEALSNNIGLDMSYFKNRKRLFVDTDIYSIGSNSSYSVFEELVDGLRAMCLELSRKIPIIWEKITKVVDRCEGVFVSIEKVRAYLKADQKLFERRVGRKQLEIVLTYMVDCGKILWYPNIPDINQFIFHRIDKVTNLIGILFAHDENVKWKKRLESFQPGTSFPFEREKYALMVEEYKESGIMAGGLLRHLVATETEFSGQGEVKVALTLLSNFRLLFGPVPMKGQESFILPYFCPGYQSGYLEMAEDDIRLHAEVAFKGLTVPYHVFNQISIGVMHEFPETTDDVALKKNGLTVYQDGISLAVTHDFKSQKVDPELTGGSGSLSKMWEMLISVRAATEQHLKKNWKAARVVTTISCAHCLIVGNPHPAKTADPEWKTRVDPRTKIKCKSDAGVPACLKHPCKTLRGEDIAVLDKYIKKQKPEDSIKRDDTLCMKENISGEASMRAGYETHSDGYGSDVSDGGGYLVPGEDGVRYDIRLSVKPTLNPAVQALSVITDKVFKMSHPKRGRALIINIENFCGSTVSEGLSLRRWGSNVDVKNLEVMLQRLEFDVVVSKDCDGRDIVAAIEDEAKNTDHEDYGMFFLCIMSHGGRDGVILGSDKAGVTLTDICDLLAPSRFPGMRGKPKVVVIQACSGERGDDGMLEDKSSSHQDSGTRPKNKASTGFTSDCNPRPDRIDHLNVDDIFIMRSSFESYKSLRNEEWGSLFIRCLVTTFYKHACHRDMYSLFKIIQHRVRTESIKIAEKYPDQYGQTVIAIDTLSRQRKLYLFPGYKPPPTMHPEGRALDPPGPNTDRPNDSNISSGQDPVDEPHVSLRNYVDEEYRESPPVEYLADQHSDGYESDEISDGGGFLAPEKEDTHMYEIRMRVRPTEDSAVKNLFNNTAKVYKMSNSRRGRALIINIVRGLSKGMDLCSKGSAMDVRNLKNMPRDFNFEVTEVKKDSNGQTILDYIAQETQNTVHEQYGMFFLCIMSHGLEDDVILSSDLAGLKLGDICDVLSPTRFTGMAGKPKVIVLQSCCGDRGPETSLVPDVCLPELQEKSQSEQLTVEDFFVLKPSLDARQARRCEESGSLFIRCLVTTFYKHACHRDIHSLYQIIRERVRAESNKQSEKYPDQFPGQTVTAIDTLSRQRKLYLFPGYNPPSTNQQDGASASQV